MNKSSHLPSKNIYCYFLDVFFLVQCRHKSVFVDINRPLHISIVKYWLYHIVKCYNNKSTKIKIIKNGIKEWNKRMGKQYEQFVQISCFLHVN